MSKQKQSLERIPTGYSETEVVTIIQAVAKKLAPKFVFDCHGVQDIEQQAFIIGWELLLKYDGRKPLQNFLSKSMKNRLVNFKRDNGGFKEKTKAASLEHEPICEDTDISKLEKVVLRKVDGALSLDLRPDFLRLLDGCPIPQHRKRLLLEKIREILNDET